MEIIFQDINMAIVKRDVEPTSKESKYLIIAKTYRPVDMCDAINYVTKIAEEKRFYVDNTLAKGLDKEILAVHCGDYDKEEYALYDIKLIQKIRKEFLEVIKHNQEWISYSNLTADEKGLLNQLIVKL